MKNQVRNIPRPKLQPVVALELVAIHAFAVHEGTVFAALVDHEKLAIFRDDRCMLARHPRVGDDQIAIHFAPDSVRGVIQR